jgi:hypothetical protein
MQLRGDWAEPVASAGWALGQCGNFGRLLGPLARPHPKHERAGSVLLRGRKPAPHSAATTMAGPRSLTSTLGAIGRSGAPGGEQPAPPVGDGKRQPVVVCWQRLHGLARPIDADQTGGGEFGDPGDLALVEGRSPVAAEQLGRPAQFTAAQATTGELLGRCLLPGGAEIIDVADQPKPASTPAASTRAASTGCAVNGGGSGRTAPNSCPSRSAMPASRGTSRLVQSNRTIKPQCSSQLAGVRVGR